MHYLNYRILSLIVMGAINTSLFAAENKASPQKSETKRHSEAHVHGLVQLSIALENEKSGSIELDAPGESIVGFEYKATKKEDIKTQKKALADLEAGMATFINLSPAAKCKWTKNKIQLGSPHHEAHHEDEQDKEGHHQGAHSELEASFSFTCENSLLGTQIQVDFGKRFKAIQEMRVTLLKSDSQSEVILKGAVGNVQL